ETPPVRYDIGEQEPLTVHSSALAGLLLLRELFDTRAGLSLLDIAAPPISAKVNPRIGLRRAGTIAKRRPVSAPEERDGMEHYTCGLTGRPFVLARGSAIPCIVCDIVEEAAAPHGVEDEIVPVHPGLGAAGPDAVRAALWERALKDLGG